MKKRLCPFYSATTLNGSAPLPSVIPTEAKRRDLQFSGPLVELLFSPARDGMNLAQD